MLTTNCFFAQFLRIDWYESYCHKFEILKQFLAKIPIVFWKSKWYWKFKFSLLAKSSTSDVEATFKHWFKHVEIKLLVYTKIPCFKGRLDAWLRKKPKLHFCKFAILSHKTQNVEKMSIRYLFDIFLTSFWWKVFFSFFPIFLQIFFIRNSFVTATLTW